VISDADDNVIGGTVTGAGNTISGNTGDGVDIDTGTGNAIIGNRIGVLPDGITAAGNASDGVRILGGARQNLVGDTASGTDTAAGNIIANNGAAGVEISSSNGSDPTQDVVRFNSIYNNGKLGIKLDDAAAPTNGAGVTPNDPGDADQGANDLQNFPTLSAASATASAVTVTGQFNSLPNSAFILDFYGTDVIDPSGSNGNGRQFLGSLNVNTNATGDADYIGTLNAAIGANVNVSATATVSAGAATGDTSEFSPSLQVNAPTSSTPTSFAPLQQTVKTTLASLQGMSHSFTGSKQQLASIKKMLAAVSRQLNAATVLVKRQTTFAAQYSREANLITALRVKLTRQSSAQGQARIQKTINADTAAQARFLNKDIADSESALTALNAVSAAQTSIQSELVLP
jgi:hypothetical protein